ncbi:MAG: hypothetical protein NZ990_05905 [Myxococcota bacterium]|nr:hypothetical protein [Myxococcota bacterium]
MKGLMIRGRQVACLSLLFCFPPAFSAAQTGTWVTDAVVGTSQLGVTIQVSCPATSFVCSLIDGYANTRISTLSGNGGLFVDAALGTLQFEIDGLQDWGIGPQPVFALMSGTGMTFESIPFAGVPEIASLLVFAASDPLIPIPGFTNLGAGVYPFSHSIPYASLADIVGDLELNVPDIVIAPQNVSVTGTYRVFGDFDLDGNVEYELRNVSAALSIQQPGNIGGEPVTIAITSALTANLSGEVAGPVVLPALGGSATLLLSGAMALLGIRASRRV